MPKVFTEMCRDIHTVHPTHRLKRPFRSLSIWSFKAVGQPKFKVVFHENDYLFKKKVKFSSEKNPSQTGILLLKYLI